MLKDIKSATKNSIIYGFNNILIKLIGLILFPIFTTKLTLAEYGILGLLEITIPFLIVIFGVNLFSGMFRFYYDKEYQHKQKTLFFTTFVFVVISSLVMSIIIWTFSKSISILLLKSDIHYYLIQLVAISSLLQVITLIPATLIRIQGKATFYTISNVLKFTITLLTTIYFIVVLERGVKGIFEGQILGSVLYLLILLPYSAKNSSYKVDFKILKTVFNYSLPLLFSTISVLFLNLTDRYCLSFFSSMSDVGLYSAGFKIANALAIIITAIRLGVTPMIFKKMDDDDNKRFYSKVLTYTALIVTFLAIGISIFSKEILVLLTKNTDYWITYILIPVISFSLIFGFFRYLATTGLSIIKKTKVIASITLVMTLLNLIINIVFIHIAKRFFHAAISPALSVSIATLLTQILYFIVTLKFSQKHYHIPYEIKKITKVVFTALLIIVVSYFLNDLNLYLKIALKMILVCSFPFILYIIGFYEKVELETIKGFWNKWKSPGKWKNNLTSLDK